MMTELTRFSQTVDHLSTSVIATFELNNQAFGCPPISAFRIYSFKSLYKEPVATNHAPFHRSSPYSNVYTHNTHLNNHTKPTQNAQRLLTPNKQHSNPHKMSGFNPNFQLPPFNGPNRQGWTNGGFGNNIVGGYGDNLFPNYGGASSGAGHNWPTMELSTGAHGPEEFPSNYGGGRGGFFGYR